jgi:hypothetical protein
MIDSQAVVKETIDTVLNIITTYLQGLPLNYAIGINISILNLGLSDYNLSGMHEYIHSLGLIRFRLLTVV